MKMTTRSKKVALLVILVACWIMFELVNYATTEFALDDILGVTSAIFGIRWSTAIAIAFAGVDFAGMSRIFTEEVDEEPEIIQKMWYAWILAAVLNAGLTWWAVSVQIEGTNRARAFIANETFVTWIPLVIALAVFLIRILLIGTLGLHGDRVLHEKPAPKPSRVKKTAPRKRKTPTVPRPGNLNPVRKSAPPLSGPLPWDKPPVTSTEVRGTSKPGSLFDMLNDPDR